MFIYIAVHHRTQKVTFTHYAYKIHNNIHIWLSWNVWFIFWWFYLHYYTLYTFLIDTEKLLQQITPSNLLFWIFILFGVILLDYLACKLCSAQLAFEKRWKSRAPIEFNKPTNRSPSQLNLCGRAKNHTAKYEFFEGNNFMVGF